MATAPLRDGIRLLCRAAAPSSAGVPDAELLDRFVRHRDEAAFELLVWRHAGMVHGTCRRLLRDAHEAEDATQAAFLVLARRASSVRRAGSVGGWLHRVAFRLALAARARRARHEAGQRPLADDTAAAPSDPATHAEWREVRRALDDEVNRLPVRYRLPFVLCCLQGRSNADAARELGCPVGTIEARLSRARARLRTALGRRGVAVSAGLFATLPVADAVALPPALVSATAKAAAGPVATGVVSANVITLTEGLMTAMWMTKLKAAAAVVLAAAVLGTGTGVLLDRSAAADPPGSAFTKAPAPTTDGDRIAKLIERLGGSAFADRERAAKDLEAIGTPALDALREAAKSGEAERKKRAEDLVKRIESRAAAAKMLAAKRVRLSYKDTPLADAVADFKAKSGYDIALAEPAGALKDRKVTLDTGEVTFWQAVDRFCAAAGLEEGSAAGPPPAGGGAGAPGGGPRAVAVGGGQGGGGGRGGAAAQGGGGRGVAGGAQGGAGGGRAVVGRPVPAAAAVGGAVRASPFVSPGRVVLSDGKRSTLPTDDGSAVRVRAAGQGDGTPATDGELVVWLEVTPEPRLRWQRTVGVDVTKATDDRGRTLEPIRSADPLPAAPAGFGPAQGRAVAGGAFGPGIAEAFTRARVVLVRLKAGEQPPAALRELSGTVALQVLTEPEPAVTVDDILNAGGKTVKGTDGAAVRVLGVTNQAGGRVQVKLAIDPPEGAAGPLNHMTMQAGRMVMSAGTGLAAEHEVAVVDEKGERLVLNSAGVQVAGAGVEYTVLVQPGPGQGPPAKLVYTVSKSVTVDVPFTLRNVPLK